MENTARVIYGIKAKIVKGGDVGLFVYITDFPNNSNNVKVMDGNGKNLNYKIDELGEFVSFVIPIHLRKRFTRTFDSVKNVDTMIKNLRNKNN